MPSHALQIRRRRRQRGATMVEYVVLLIAVAVPSIAAAIPCFVAVYTWYMNFVSTVSQPGP
jgi:Flp pilus assembly pilin Flp